LNSLPPLETLGNRPIILPPKQTSFQKTLVLDLDETLVHCSTDGLSNPDLSFGIEFNDEKFTVYARKRPHLEKFLELVSSMFEVIIFTASQKVYADTLLNIIDKENKWIQLVFF
jgi:CTD small phosphatase-like protein 2